MSAGDNAPARKSVEIYRESSEEDVSTIYYGFCDVSHADFAGRLLAKSENREEQSTGD